MVMALGQQQQQGNPPNQNNTSSFEKAIHEEDGDCMRGCCCIFTEMGECDLSLMLSHEEMNQQALVELILWCSAIVLLLAKHGAWHWYA